MKNVPVVCGICGANRSSNPSGYSLKSECVGMRGRMCGKLSTVFQAVRLVPPRNLQHAANAKKPIKMALRRGGLRAENWLRGVDLNHRPSGYEPDELPGCSTPRSEPQKRTIGAACHSEQAISGAARRMPPRVTRRERLQMRGRDNARPRANRSFRPGRGGLLSRESSRKRPQRTPCRS